MIARGAEANPSCFSPSGLSDPMDVILPLYTRVSMVVNNAFQNTKYCIYAMDLASTSKPAIPGIKNIRHKLKSDMSHLKDYRSLCELLGLDYDAIVDKEKRIGDVLTELEGKLKVEDGLVERETESELLRRKVPKVMQAESESNNGDKEKEKEEEGEEEGSSSSSKENVPVLASV